MMLVLWYHYNLQYKAAASAPRVSSRRRRAPWRGGAAKGEDGSDTRSRSLSEHLLAEVARAATLDRVEHVADSAERVSTGHSAA
jgi:hypothetical protein